MNKSDVSVIGDVFPKSRLEGYAVDFGNNWVALCKIKSNPVALSDTLNRGKFFIRVYRFGTIEAWFRDVILTVDSSTGIADTVSLMGRGQRNSTSLKLILHKEGDYWVLYAKGGNSYDHISYQLLYAPYPSFITPIHELITVSASAMSGYASNTKVFPTSYYPITVTPEAHCTLDADSYHNDYTVDDDGTVNLNLAFYTDGALPLVQGTKLATVSRGPYRKSLMTYLTWWTIDNTSSGVVPAYINISGGIISKGNVPANARIGLSARYKTIDNSII